MSGQGGGQRSNLQLRVMSGVVLAALAIAVTLAGGIWFRLFAAIIALASLYEWLRITGMKPLEMPGIAISVSVLAVVLFVLFGAPVTWPLLLVLIASAAVPFLYRQSETLPRSIVSGAVWHCGLPVIALANLRGDTQSGLMAILFLYAVVWATDIFAYFVGRSVGGPKLAPSISPGKTWSGAVGGTAFGVAAGAGIAAYGSERPLLVMAALALALSVAGQLGDLYESALKRRYGVKDSSNLIPGHGGVLDRVDALVIAAIVLYALAALLSGESRPSGWLFR